VATGERLHCMLSAVINAIRNAASVNATQRTQRGLRKATNAADPTTTADIFVFVFRVFGDSWPLRQFR